MGRGQQRGVKGDSMLSCGDGCWVWFVRLKLRGNAEVEIPCFERFYFFPSMC